MSQSQLRIAIATTFLTLTSLAQAATWQALSGHFQSSPEAFFQGGQDFVFGGDYFEDGQYSVSHKTRVLATAGVPIDPQSSLAVGFLQGFAAPPQIDLTNMRGNFSSLFWFGFHLDGTEAIGGNYGGPGWTSLTDNGNGTYSATWVVSPDNYFSGPGTFSITIAQAIPEASMPAYLMLGLVSLALAVKRRRSST
ncbi:MAG TPA: hypothetical protein VGM81_05115 [Burkholderiaceae bacterium]|jgi:hypothetical protein